MGYVCLIRPLRVKPQSHGNLGEGYQVTNNEAYGGGEIPPPGLYFSMDKCKRCLKYAVSLHYENGDWVCRHCRGTAQYSSCRLFEYGVENPVDPKGSTAHVRDIKKRRIDPKTKTVFNYEPPKTYFYK
jgi:hypothetical protein